MDKYWLEHIIRQEKRERDNNLCKEQRHRNILKEIERDEKNDKRDIIYPDDWVCMICHDNASWKSLVFCNSCKNVSCKICIDTMITYGNNKCPACRKRVIFVRFTPYKSCTVLGSNINQ